MKLNNRPLVSIITINYNSLEYTLDLLRSIAENPYRNTEIIVVDNASSNDPGPAILEAYPTVQYIRSDINLGFAGGNNLGLKAAKGDYLFLVNNDTEFTNSLVFQLIDCFEKDENIGLISPKILFYKTNIIQFAGFTPMTMTGRNSALGNQRNDGPEFQSLIESPYGHGAAMMITRRLLKKVGLMPEAYFLYYEELDWSEMIRRAGFRLMVMQKAIIFHKESRSIGKHNPVKTYYLTRNRILFARRNFTGFKKMVFLIYYTSIGLPKNILGYLFKKDFTHAKKILQGYCWNLGIYHEGEKK